MKNKNVRVLPRISEVPAIHPIEGVEKLIYLLSGMGKWYMTVNPNESIYLTKQDVDTMMKIVSDAVKRGQAHTAETIKGQEV